MGEYAITVPQCGHPDRRHAARRMCRSCYNTWHLRTHEEARLRQNEQRAKHRREHIERMRPKEKVFEARRTPEVVRNMVLQRYRLTPETFERLRAHQRGGCAICGKVPVTEPLHIDHCHTTGTIRGLLCRKCNTHISSLEVPGWLEAAQGYLASYPSHAVGIHAVCVPSKVDRAKWKKRRAA